MSLEGINLNYHEDQNGNMTPEVEYPNLTNLGKYGSLRLSYLYEHNQPMYGQMLLDGTLEQHLKEIDEEATQRVLSLTKQMQQQENLSEDLKNSDPLKWTGMMNNFKAAAEEIVLNELIYI